LREPVGEFDEAGREEGAGAEDVGDRLEGVMWGDRCGGEFDDVAGDFAAAEGDADFAAKDGRARLRG
jgi:hypothetical protein